MGRTLATCQTSTSLRARNLSIEFFVADVTIGPGPKTLLDASGSAIVIHSGKDDHVTEPAGESGHRLACAAISQSAATRQSGRFNARGCHRQADIAVADDIPREQVATCSRLSRSQRSRRDEAVTNPRARMTTNATVLAPHRV